MQQQHTFVGERNRYELVNLLARGPIATLYTAITKDGETVCIKSFPLSEPKKNWEHYIKEISARRILSHPNILPILDYGMTTDPSFGFRAPFIAMPMCKGGTLRDLLKSSDYLSPKEYIPILKQLSQAIDFSHEAGIIHGDIKPSNVLFPEKNLSHVVISDFGIAKFFPINEDITSTGDEEGTIAYLSPEQIEDNQQTPRSDIYALATVSFVALTGKLPVDTKLTTYKQMRAKIEGDLLDPRDVNPSLGKGIADALMIGLRENPWERPVSASEYVNALIAASNQQGKLPKNAQKSWWKSLNRAQKVLLVATIITALGTVLAAIITGLLN